MLSNLLLALAAPLCAAPALQPVSASHGNPTALVAQDDEEIPDKRPEIKDALTELKDFVKARGAEDQQAIAVIDTLIGEFPKSGPKDRKAIVGGVSDCLSAKRKDLSDGVPDNGLYIAAATALGRMGPESVKSLSNWIGHKKQKDDMQVQRALILSLGRTKDTDGLKALLGTLDNHQAAIVAAGAEALGDFEGADLDERKEIFNELLKVLAGAKGAMDNDVNDRIARERYDVIAAPLITSLKRLSGHDENQPEEWTRWWNKNKKKDWDKDPEDGGV